MFLIRVRIPRGMLEGHYSVETKFADGYIEATDPELGLLTESEKWNSFGFWNVRIGPWDRRPCFGCSRIHVSRQHFRTSTTKSSS